MFKHNLKLITIDFCSELNENDMNIIILEKKLQGLKEKVNKLTFNNQIDEITLNISYYELKADAAKIRSKSKFIQDNEKSTAYIF